MRCLTLADALRDRGADVHFICRSHEGNLIDSLRQRGTSVMALPAPSVSTANAADEDYAAWLGVTEQQDAVETLEAIRGLSPDWLIVDHYGVGRSWEQALRSRVKQIMVVDDLADRHHDCELLLDQNDTTRSLAEYQTRVPDRCKLAIGPRYALMRPEYARNRNSIGPRSGTVCRVLVFFGGSDPLDMTGLALEALSAPEFLSLQVDLVIGANYARRGELERAAATRPGTRLLGPQPHLADLLASADLSIGAGGSTTWERLCLGVPALIVSLAENQRSGSEMLARKGLAKYLGPAQQMTVDQIRGALRECLQSPAQVAEMAANGQSLVDGLGTARICECLLPSAIESLVVRPVRESDMALYFAWANDPDVRRQSLSPDPIPLARHRDWFAAKVATRNSHLFVLMAGPLPVGQIRFDIADGVALIDYSIDSLFRGRGWAARLVALGVQSLAERSSLTIRAEVKPGNPASVAVFQRLGFKEATALSSQGLRAFELAPSQRLAGGESACA